MFSKSEQIKPEKVFYFVNFNLVFSSVPGLAFPCLWCSSTSWQRRALTLHSSSASSDELRAHTSHLTPPSAGSSEKTDWLLGWWQGRPKTMDQSLLTDDKQLETCPSILIILTLTGWLACSILHIPTYRNRIYHILQIVQMTQIPSTDRVRLVTRTGLGVCLSEKLNPVRIWGVRSIDPSLPCE